ncbi:MAG: tetratricopeptide repeat protein, partial [Bacteroidota bacterium]
QYHPDFREALLNRGDVYTQLGQLELALQDFDQLVLQHPDYGDAHFNRGAVLSRLGQDQHAYLAYQRALEINPDDREARARMDQLAP